MSNPNFEEHWDVSKLIIKKLNGTLSVTEQQQLDAWLASDAANQAMLDRLLNEDAMVEDMALINSFDTEQMLLNIRQRIDTEKHDTVELKRTPVIYYKTIAAVVAVAAALVLVFFIISPNRNKEKATIAQVQKDSKTPLADSNHLYLTLADGSKIDLDSVGKGVIGHQGNAVITKSADRQLNYNAGKDAVTDGEVAFNSLAIPKGKQYEMVLPDGSKVWLNAQTTLRFPVAFSKNNREVELDGEAYFEVVHNPNWPFHVKIKDQTVEVLGTHFNVEAYSEDGKTTTALVEGKVRVHKENSHVDIKPGQMAINDLSASKIITKTADLESILAWKNGLFYFKDERVEDIMKRVGRTYNIDIEYKGDIKNKRFWATYPIAQGLDNLLKTLEQTNSIHFEKRQGKIIVTP